MLKRRRFEEYAQVTTVLECKRLDLRYYADVAGPVPVRDTIKPELSGEGLNEDHDVGNGDLPPEWGADITISDGVLQYGPWTDRQRGMMQSFFFPTAYRTPSKTEKLAPGATRLFVALKILLKFTGETKFRIPFREQSKDWRFYDDAMADDDGNPNVKVGSTGRPYAWLDLKMTGTSSVDVTVPFVMSEKGYTMMVHVALDNVSLASSLNYAPLLSAQSLKIECQLENPLQWNAPRIWTFNILLSSMKMFLLRDHVTLLTDLMKDWTSGPSNPQEYFVPMLYKIKLTMTDFDLHFCVNQNNVINQPNDLSDNSYFVLSGPRIKIDVDLPFLHFEDESTTVSFQVESRKARLSMNFPVSHTIGAFMTDRAKEVGTVGHLAVNGTYRYHRAVSPGAIDGLTINVNASALNFILYGYLVSHLIFFKENYMGEHNSFMTSDEYRTRLADTARAETAWRKQEAAKEKGNQFEVFIVVSVQNAVAALPESLYDAQECSLLSIGEIQVESRNNDFYHDVQVVLQPIRWNRGSARDLLVQPRGDTRKNFIFVQDFAVRGHRLFGLPPKGSVYAADWRLNAGPIVGELQPSALPAIRKALRCFTFHYANVDNMLTASTILPDLTTVLAVVQSVHISIWGLGSVTTLRFANGIRIQMDNLVSQTWSERIFVEVPDILLHCLAVTTENGGAGNADIASMDDSIWVEVFKGTTALSLCLYGQTPQWEAAQKLQMDYIKTQDDITRRCTFLYQDEPNGGGLQQAGPGRRRHNNRSSDSNRALPYLPTFNPPFQLSRHHRSAQQSNPFSPESDAELSTPSPDSVTEADSEFSSDDESGPEAEEGDFDWSAQIGDDAAPPPPPEAPPPPRSIPYRTYLRRFIIDKAKRDPLHNLFGHRGLSMTSFTEIGSDTIGDIRVEESFSSEKPFNKALKRARQSELPPSPTSDEQTTVLSIDVSRPVKLLVTPITLRILQEGLENLRGQTPNPESILDALEVLHTTNLIKSFLYEYASSSFFVSAPLLQIHCIQDMLLPDVTSFLHQDATARYELSDKLLCSFDIIINGVTARVKHTTHRPPEQPHQSRFVANKFTVDVDRVTTKLRFVGNMNATGVVGIPSSKQSHRSHSEGMLEGVPVVLDLLADKIQWRGNIYEGNVPNKPRDTNGCSLELSTKELSVVSINETIEILFGAIFKWGTFAHDVAKLYRSFTLREQKELQALISMVAEKAHATSTDGDPAFLTQPSTLWMLGNRKHQDDSGWKLIAHLRYCLRYLPNAAKRDIQKVLDDGKFPTTDSKLLFVTVLKSLSAWRRWEVADLTSAPMLRDLYNVKPIPSPATQLQSQEDIMAYMWNAQFKMDISKLSVTVFEFQNDDSSIVIGPITVSIVSSLRERTISKGEDNFRTPQSSVPMQIPTPSPGNNHEDTLDVRYRLKIDRLDCVINPNLFGFVRHFLRVQRWFQARLESASRAKPARHVHESSSSIQARETTSGMPIVIFGTAAVVKLSLAATAHNLMAKATFGSLQISSIHVLNPARTPQMNVPAINPSPDNMRGGPQKVVHNSIGTLIGIDVVMFERSSRASQPSEANTLISLALDDLSLAATVSEGNGGHLLPTTSAEKTSFAVGIRYIKLRLPRSLLKLHAFLEKWGDEDLPRYDFLFNKLVNEWDSTGDQPQPRELRRMSSSKLSLTHGRPKLVNVSFEFLLGHFSVQSDLLSSLNVFYDAYDLLVMITNESIWTGTGPESNGVSRSNIGWEARLREHVIKFLSKGKAQLESTDDTPALDQQTASFHMPTASSRGSMSQSFGESGRSTPADSTAGFGSDYMTETSDPKRIEAMIEIDRIEASVDVSIIDQLITTQSVFGGELNDVLDILSFYGRRKAQKRRGLVKKHPTLGAGRILYALKFTVQGLRIAADSPGSIILFESDSINGFIMNYPQKELSRETGGLPTFTHPDKVLWRIAVRRFSFSLLRNIGTGQSWMMGARGKLHPLAYVVMGVTAQNYGATDSSAAPSRGKPATDVKMLSVKIHQLHAVLQPTAMTSLTDAAVYYKKELERRSGMKARELAKAKENTERFIKGIRLPIPNKIKKQSFLEERTIQVDLANICAAMPLRQVDKGTGPTPQPTTRGPSGRRSTVSSGSADFIPAFLISAKAVHLKSKKLRWASGQITDLSFQFVPNFDSSNERHFSPILHPTSNRILLQQTTAEITRQKADMKHFVRIESGIKGFELEVDATITEYANQLNAIYMTEREYVAMNGPNGSNSNVASTNVISEGAPSELGSHLSQGNLGNEDASRSDVQTEEGPDGVFLEFDARFAFEAGTCKVWSSKTRSKGYSSESSPPMSSSQLSTGGTSQKTGDTGAQDDPCLHLLTLPGITLSTMGKTVMGELSKHSELEELAKGVHIELIIHSSNNVLHPDILHFANDVQANLKVGRIMKHQEQLENGIGSSLSVVEGKPAPDGSSPTMTAYQRHAITFNLRLQHTKFSLSCQPVSKVSCNMNLEEADFMFSFIPKAMRKDKTQYLSCTANILGTSGALRHAFSPEDCLNAEVARITFNITTMERKLNRIYTVEIGIPSLMGSLNARHLQDFFLFQRLWGNPSNNRPGSRSSRVRNSLGGLQIERRTYGSSLLSFVGDDGRSLKDAIHLAARVNRIEFAMDLGQAIGKATLGLDNLVVSGSGARSIAGFQQKEVSIKFESVGLKSEGKFSGTMSISGAQAYFNAHEPPAPKRGQKESSVGTELVVRIDHLASHLHYQYERILILHVSPIHGGFTDKWITTSDDLQVCINADLTVDTFKGIMSRRTIPTILQLKTRITQLIDEKRGAEAAGSRTGTSSRRDTSVSGLSATQSGAILSQKGKQSLGSLNVDLLDNPKPFEATTTGRDFLNQFWMGAATIGRINVVLGEAFIVLARYNFRDPDFAQVTSKRVAATYTGSRGTSGQAVEDTVIHLGGLNVKKGTAKSISQAEESMWTTAQWFTFMTSAATKNVFGVRETKVRLQTETFFLEPIVEYSFRTDFSGPIDVALNFGLYKYLQELGQLYEKALAKSAESSAEDGPKSGGPSPTGPTSSQFRSTSPTHPQSATSANSATPTNDSPTSGKSSAPSITGSEDAQKPPFAFVRKGEMFFEPQLKVTGDATPWEWVQWLGVHKEKVPRLVYDQVTVNLAQIVDLLSGIHRKVAIPVQDASESVNIDMDSGAT
ncbi:hypothetical protein DFJ77DRAFT_289393 [Powellomyces hirtus]|nr:hypothetical protein DFJ77DRAFT_289393 [Powellomyces hirtus]